MALFAQLLHSARAAPRLARAARAQGLSARESATSLHIAVAALRVATERGRGIRGRINAVRHFVWQSLLTAHFSASVAERLGEVHEEGTPHAEDSRVDLHNNAVGRAYGESHAAELAATSVGSAADRAAQAALTAWEEGDLIWVDSLRRQQRAQRRRRRRKAQRRGQA